MTAPPAAELPTAVVFDCDGTLVDSERLARQSWTTVMRGHGYTVTDADVDAMFGRPYPVIYAHLASRAAVPPQEELWQRFAAEMFDLVSTTLVVFPDAEQVVRELSAAGVALAVASSSPRDRLDHTLATSGLADLFDVVVAGDEISRGKPDPDIFLTAAEELGVPPTSCVVVEDSPTGVSAGLAAGMQVVAVVRDPAHRDLLGGAHVVVDALDVAALCDAAVAGTGEVVR